MHAFEPRLLMPGTPGAPSHIAVSHDPAVYEQMANPRITAAVYVPCWSQPVTEAFERLAKLRVSKQRNFEDEFRLSPAMLAMSGELEDFALECTIRWLRPAFKPHAREENIHVVHEVAAEQTGFAKAAARLLNHHPNRKPNFHAVLKALHVDDMADTRVNLQHPEHSLAHTDPGDTGLFAKPLGTVLVDQDGLDIKGLRIAQEHGKVVKGIVHRIPLTHLANRLWQIPDGAFGLWRGEPHENAQYHFFPQIKENVQRFRTFAHP